jgi:CO dehydrogenase maturation factor
MRLAFVGKGGAGKSTLSALMTLYIAQQSEQPVLVFDADLNIHIPHLLGFETIPAEHHISHPTASSEIKRWLIKDNPIAELGAFRKTTPPTMKSNIIKPRNLSETPLVELGRHRQNISAFVVGTYQHEDIGASCYHNNLAVFENILSHTDDVDSYIVADMVAGVDAFAGTLHAQFDMTIFVVEPTRRSLEVCEQYMDLATKAETSNQLFIIGNKVRNHEDIQFISDHLPNEKLLGYFYDDDHLRQVDQERESLQISLLQKNNLALLNQIFEKLNAEPNNSQARLKKLWSLHQKYISQAFVKERFGDLHYQIDQAFSFDHE